MTPPNTGGGRRGRDLSRDASREFSQRRAGDSARLNSRARAGDEPSYEATRRAGASRGSVTGGHSGARPAPRPTGQKAAKRAAKMKRTQREIMVHRLRVITSVLVIVSVVLIGRLAWVQVVWGPDLATKAAAQRERLFVEPARRGEIVDRDGQRLAYTMQARSLTVSPTRLRDELREQEENAAAEDGVLVNKSETEVSDILDERVEDRLKEMADGIPKMIEDAGASASEVNSRELMDKLRADTQYEVLVRNVDPDVAVEIASQFHGVAADHQDIRQYPNGAIAENVIGKTSMDGQGQFGFEASGDAMLTGIKGRSTEAFSSDGQAIPGTLNVEGPTIDGKNVQLTLDLDLQTYLQQKLEKARANSDANSVEAVVLDAATGEVLAMANTGTIDPNEDIEKQLKEGKDFENRSISHPFEPGSVAKMVTAAAAIEEGVTTPDEVHQVPGTIDMAGVTVKDAWQHGVEPYTTAGIMGKSSNVGTLMLAQQLGEEKFSDYLEAFGLGQTSGIELPNESSGIVPPLSQWSGGTFANLPIGQGMSWTTLQMASVYQTLANEGQRITPRIISKVTGPDGEDIEQPAPETTQVVSPETAKTITNMFRATFQDDPAGIQNGTAQGNNIEGYQLAGKTGTAQKVDPNTGAYSNSAYWITFAGIAPADDPRFVVAIMVDEPKSGVNDDGGGGQSAAPIFRDIAAWLMSRDNIPTSPEAERLTLRAE